uniref:Uncharacterized protein n=1 Tax=Arundo donax TaxID=35708 RepID=A0A0A9FIG5_ARUDO
MNNLLLLWYC